MQKRSIRSRSYRPSNTQNKHDMGIKDGIDVAKFMGIPSVVIRSAVWVMLGIIVGGYSTYVIVVAHIEREQNLRGLPRSGRKFDELHIAKKSTEFLSSARAFSILVSKRGSKKSK